MSARGSSGGVKLPQIRNAADARELAEEQAAKAAARKPKAALTPAEKRAAKLRQEQLKEEAAASKKLKESKLADLKAARRASGGLPLSVPGSARRSTDASPMHSSRQSASNLQVGGDGYEGAYGSAAAAGDDNVDFIENEDGTFSAVPRGLDSAGSSYDPDQPTQDELDEAAASLAAAEAEKKAEENYDIIFDGPKSPLIMATAAKHIHEMMRLIQEVPLEYRVEFVNAYDDHGCSALFFAIGPEHLDCMQLLLDYGADPNHQNNKKNGPLHIACAIQNKKAARVLIEHGANIALENWQYQKPHEMVTERDKVSSTQAYLNLCLETYQEKVASKQVIGNITRHQRSYYRSMFDIADRKEMGVLTYDSIEPRLDVAAADAQLPKPDPRWTFAFFSGWDTDKNGVISFVDEWLPACVKQQEALEKQKKKDLKKQQLLAKKRAKAAAAAAAAAREQQQQQAQ